MILFLLSCFSFILVLKSYSVKPLVSRLREMGLQLLTFSVLEIPAIMPMMKGNTERVEEEVRTSLLDLPELAMDCILERLSPAELCSMAGACRYLREMCRSDHLWENHMEKKWGGVIGKAAHREWQWYMTINKRRSSADRIDNQGILGFILGAWPWPFWLSRAVLGDGCQCGFSVRVDSIMSWYLSLERGRFWFPAQVYNRENGHAGFLLSCYDAELCYNSRTNTFQARYSPHGRHTIEENVSWDRLRAPPVDTPAYDLHVSDCLDDLIPGDHFEIQWRRNKDYPYGWWYGVVGHLESCDRNENNCICQHSDAVMLEFNQYHPDSRWRRTTVNRMNHRQEGNEADGFYGGIRKLYNEKEISAWRNIWPTKVLD